MKTETRERILKELDLALKPLFTCAEELGRQENGLFQRDASMRVAANRLFMGIEHLANVFMLMECGNFTEKHSKDISRYNQIMEKSGISVDLKGIYESSAGLRRFADYGRGSEKEFKEGEMLRILKEADKMLQWLHGAQFCGGAKSEIEMLRTAIAKCIKA